MPVTSIFCIGCATCLNRSFYCSTTRGAEHSCIKRCYEIMATNFHLSATLRGACRVLLAIIMYTEHLVWRLLAVMNTLPVCIRSLPTL
eukprot:g79364.t1